ncbi:alpha/beta hydrolase [soil metagenome]
MQIPQRVELTLLRAVMALPESAQRVLGGGSLVLDGQTLAPETRLTLRLKELTRMPGVEELPMAQARALVDRQAALTGGTQPIGAVRDLPVAGLPGRLYTPTDPAPDPLPLLVFFHGGGFMYGGLDSHDAPCRLLAERAGVRVLAVDYRLAPEHRFPAAHDDAVAAYRWVVANAASLGADPSRLAVGGDSAGAKLSIAVAAAAAAEGLPLAFQLLVYPGTDFTRATRSHDLFAEGLYLTREFIELANSSYVPDPADALDPRMSPLLHDVPPGLAPAYVATAGFDPLRDEGEAYARKLADAGVSVQLRRFSDQIHSFFNICGVGRRSPAAVAEIALRLKAGLARPGER